MIRYFSGVRSKDLTSREMVRGIKRRRNAGKSFVLSDHADWPGLNEAVKNSQARYIYVTHGYKDVFAKWLSEKGYTAQPLETLFEGESED